MMKKLNTRAFVIAFIILAVLPIFSLFHPGLPWTHDGQDHVARIANFYANLTQGNIIPRWAANLNWGYGHPILEFLYPLPSYTTSFFHFLGLSLVNSVKIVYGLGMILSLVFMFLWLSQFISRYSALSGAVLYAYAPYRFVDLYVRGDIGENLAFAFVPLVLYFIYRIYKKNDYKNSILGGISLALLILSHNAIAPIFVPFIFLYGLLLFYSSKNRKSYAINFVLLIISGFCLSAFFWIPGLFEGKYTLRNIVTKGGYLQSFVSFGSLIYGGWNYGQTGQFTVQFGPFQWIALLLSPLTLYKFRKNKQNSCLILLLIISCLLSIFIMLPISNFIWARIILLQNFQFPWRFLSIVVFSMAVLGALLFEIIPNKINLKIVALCIAVIVAISSFYWKPKGYINKPESFYTGIYNGTTDTGESAPIWSVRFMEHAPSVRMQVIDGSAKISQLQRTITKHSYLIDVLKPTLFMENTLYFPGWEIKANGVPVGIQFQNENYRGIMTFRLSPGEYNVAVAYGETKLRLISDLISAASIVTVFAFFGLGFVKKKRF